MNELVKVEEIAHAHHQTARLHGRIQQRAGLGFVRILPRGEVWGVSACVSFKQQRTSSSIDSTTSDFKLDPEDGWIAIIKALLTWG